MKKILFIVGNGDLLFFGKHVDSGGFFVVCSIIGLIVFYGLILVFSI